MPRAGSDKPIKGLTFPELTELRRKTEAISKFLHDQLSTHLDTLRPILAPERLFGRHLDAKGDATQADRAFAQLQQSYRPFATRPFDLPSELDPHWLALVGNRVTLYPWEYTYEAKTEHEAKTITMASPVRWVVSFTSGYTLSQMRSALTGKGERRPEHVRQFAVNALVTQLVIAHAPGLTPLLGDLGYQLKTDHAADLPKLPLTTITFSLTSFRPADELILAATTFSGVPAFIELVETDAVARMQDPLQARMREVLR